MLKRSFIILGLCFFTSLAFTQIGGPIGGPIPEDGIPCGPPFGPPCDIPIDGGVSLLIAAGLALGGKKVLDAKRKA